MTEEPQYVTISQFAKLCDEVAENTRLTKQVQASTSTMVAAFDAANGAFKVLEILGRVFKPILVISSAVAGAYTWWINFKGH